MTDDATTLPPLRAELFLNPAARRDEAYGPRRGAVLGQAALAEARAEITRWPGYAPTPLHRLGALAARLGVADVAYKDEGGRFGLGSFKALG
ncbi:MAG TPA: diaminopropionate ammonia-lyase, partial [Ottowia sp.]|nr:diaminopropionate ammonia-lyase [Ottowia sp.]HPP99098.1 diaminopropionate ammonia-lyase [Ottowia sp.]